ncbi:gliding motility-associated C-terminal domain-containing protein [Tunicatimonas pelagia]|uniref:gliding motility-associated C-terminal domain-containing protein n=1 Tax=Tunicatimonas pelagia TaxID=931531 RepID=UPI0026655327|nr:gliding motility-associated C-terminal domain-containing protein [Tunicatimonas pelagia]WKN43606.1 gliding motility-associated C-terminal domain-containing protein [Tunicatimonas pelagia]
MRTRFFINIGWCLLVSISSAIISNLAFGQSLTGVEGTSITYTEGDGAVQITNSLSVTSNTLLSYATVAIGSAYNASEDTLIYRGEAGIYPIFNNETGELLLLSFPAGSATESGEMQAALRSVFYQNKNEGNPQNSQRTVSFTVYAQNVEGSNTISRAIDVQGVDDIPRLLSPTNTPLVVNSLATPVPLVPDLQVIDSDDAFMTAATVRIGEVQFDQLVFTNNSNDNIVIQRAEGTNRRLILTGRDTKENYQAALRSIGVQNLFSARGFKGNRKVEIQITDEKGEASNLFEQYVYVLSQSNPNNTPPSTQDILVSIAENQTLNFEAQQFQLAYTDSEQAELSTIRIRSLPKHGFLSLNGVEVDADFLVQDQGVVAREDLDKLTYVPNRAYVGSDQFEWSTTDGTTPSANTSTVSISIAKAALPLLLTVAENALVDEDKVTILPSISLQAPPHASLNVTLSVETGQLSVVPIILPFISIAVEGGNELSFSGTAQAVRFALSGLQYSPANNVVGNDILKIAVSSSTEQEDGILVITIAPIDDPVVLSNIEVDTLEYTENSPALPITNSLLLTDPDGAIAITSATVTVPEGLNESEEQLTYNLTGGVTATLNEGRLEFSGEGSLRQYQSILRSVAYKNLSNNPQTTLLTFEFQATDENDSVSNVASRVLRVAAVDDSTVLTTAEPKLLSYVLESSAVPFHSSLTVTDVDSDSLTRMVVFFEVGYDPAIDSILVSVLENMTVAWDEEVGSLEISGKNSTESYQAMARSLLYQSAATQVQVSRQITVQVFNDETPSNSVSRTVQLIENTPPVVVSFSKKGVQNGAFGFTVDDFLTNYTDADNSPVPNQFSSLRVVTLPTQGVLTVANDTITQQKVDQSPGGFFLSSQNISQLFYRPATDYLGEDQWAWNAFDGAELADDSALVALTVVPALTVNLPDSVEICPGETIALSVEVLSGEEPFTFSWSCNQEDCQIESATDDSVVVVSPVAAVQYVVRITSSDGLDSVQDTISVLAVDCSEVPLEIPSAFTPNDDNINDLWVLPNASIFSSVQVTVYDRFGKSVFESADYQNNWDGTYEGRELPAGSYYYTIVLPRELKDYSGTVTLLR